MATIYYINGFNINVETESINYPPLSPGKNTTKTFKKLMNDKVWEDRLWTSWIHFYERYYYPPIIFLEMTVIMQTKIELCIFRYVLGITNQIIPRITLYTSVI
jgi:hypothetical protein